MLVFGIIPSKDYGASTKEDKDKEIHYNFAVYQNFMIL